MLDGVNADRAFANCGSALYGLQIFKFGVDRWLILQILASEFDSVIHRRGVQSECRFFTSVQRGASETGNFANRLLKLGSSHSGLK
jgi:hypothetical protein